MTTPHGSAPPLRQRLVVGFDGSDASVYAIEWAATEAAVRGASVHVISSYSLEPVIDFGTGASGSGVDLTEVESSCRRLLDAAATEVFARHPGVDHDVATVRQSPGLALLREAEQADLVVVGSSGAGTITRFLLGSVAGSLLASSPCPVVVVPAAVQPTVGEIVVGTDGSEHAAHAVRWAADEADRRGGRLVVVHVWRYGYRLTMEGIDRADDFTPVDEQLILDQAVEAARDASGVEVEGRLIEGGVTDTLLDLSTTAELLVVGSRGRGGFRAMLFGSTANAMATHASCPTVIVR